MLFASKPPSLWATVRSSAWERTCIRQDRETKMYRATLWTLAWSWRAPSVVLIRWDSYTESNMSSSRLFLPLRRTTWFANVSFDSLPHTRPSLYRFVLMENAATHLFSARASATPGVTGMGWVSVDVKEWFSCSPTIMESSIYILSTSKSKSKSTTM